LEISKKTDDKTKLMVCAIPRVPFNSNWTRYGWNDVCEYNPLWM